MHDDGIRYFPPAQARTHRRRSLRPAKAYDSTVPKIVTVEDHFPEGGLGEAIGAVVGSKVVVCAVTTRPHSGSPDELQAEQGIDAKGILRAVVQ